MNIKNYTSTVSVSSSISKIEHRLAQAKALYITKEYKNEIPVGMMFQIDIEGIPRTFKLPAKVEKVYDYMIRQKSKGYRKDVQETTKRQAQMTAWKILSDWIDIQVSLIILEQAEAGEIFFPYLYSVKEDKTLYQLAKENNFKLLNQENN
jgi:hypothetical protein